jgi:hypothetical protein
MKRIGVRVWWVILCGLVAAHSVCAQEEKPGGGRGDEISKLVGNWSGESVCVNREKFPACNDEQVIYRVAVARGKSDTLTITADKLVNGKPETMGTYDFVYDARAQTLVSEIKTGRGHLVIELSVKGDLLEGTLATLPDKTVVRRIKVKKDK